MSRGWTIYLPNCKALRFPKQYLGTLHIKRNARTSTRVTFFPQNVARIEIFKVQHCYALSNERNTVP
jgi:hypothetical protein